MMTQNKADLRLVETQHDKGVLRRTAPFTKEQALTYVQKNHANEDVFGMEVVGSVVGRKKLPEVLEEWKL